MQTAATWCVCLVVALTSCVSGGSGDDDTESHAPVGSVAQALTDTDSDGMSDPWETQHFGNLSQDATGDVDADGMTNGEEYLFGFDPTVKDSHR